MFKILIIMFNFRMRESYSDQILRGCLYGGRKILTPGRS